MLGSYTHLVKMSHMRSKRVFLLGHCRNCNAGNCAAEFCVVCTSRRPCPRCNRRLDDSSFIPTEGGLCHACWLKSQRPIQRRSFRRTLEQADVPIYDAATDIESFVHSNSSVIEDIIQTSVATHRAVKFFITCDLEFVRDSEAGQQSTSAGFRTNTTTDSYYDPTDIVNDLNNQIQNFNQRGSNWIVSRMLNFSVMTAAYSPLAGSSYIKTHKFLVDKKCCTNINNITDEFCFIWCILGVIHPVTRNPSELYNYRRYLNELDVSGLVFPMPVRSIERFERLNPPVSVNVFFSTKTTRRLCRST